MVHIMNTFNIGDRVIGKTGPLCAATVTAVFTRDALVKMQLYPANMAFNEDIYYLCKLDTPIPRYTKNDVKELIEKAKQDNLGSKFLDYIEEDPKVAELYYEHLLESGKPTETLVYAESELAEYDF